MSQQQIAASLKRNGVPCNSVPTLRRAFPQRTPQRQRADDQHTRRADVFDVKV
jgi:hypothetical protein